MAQEKATLQYFQFGGRAECIRLLCVAHDYPFEDSRFGFAEWPTIKPTTPYGGVPVLTVEGRKGAVPESNAILRYFGKKTGTYPTDDYVAACVDSVCDGIEEVAALIAPTMREQDAEKKKAAREHWATVDIALWGERFQRQHDTLGTKFIVSDTVSIADYKIGAFVGWIKSGALDHVPTDCLDKYPVFDICYRAVFDDEKVKAYKAQGK